MVGTQRKLHKQDEMAIIVLHMQNVSVRAKGLVISNGISSIVFRRTSVKKTKYQ